jgi:hypothetical protein
MGGSSLNMNESGSLPGSNNGTNPGTNSGRVIPRDPNVIPARPDEDIHSLMRI